ncbi:hypothetical protein [Nocardia blacklockiae]|uniref:hypothetical protein n=1 Tax=Nocardia blacklockiae TaxID=480036 RepID=UPI001E5C93B6|nr:hypothetical protein [Nocardia blacklockiae]
MLDLSQGGIRRTGDLAHRRAGPTLLFDHSPQGARDGFATFSVVDLFRHPHPFHSFQYT